MTRSTFPTSPTNGAIMPRSEIAISAQVWVCDDCGSQTPKTCGCHSSAHMEELRAAKREANRKAASRYREKAQQNQRSRHNDAGVENTRKSGLGGGMLDPNNEEELARYHAEIEPSLQEMYYEQAVDGVTKMNAATRKRFMQWLRSIE